MSSVSDWGLSAAGPGLPLDCPQAQVPPWSPLCSLSKAVSARQRHRDPPDSLKPRPLGPGGRHCYTTPSLAQVPAQ